MREINLSVSHLNIHKDIVVYQTKGSRFGDQVEGTLSLIFPVYWLLKQKKTDLVFIFMTWDIYTEY